MVPRAAACGDLAGPSQTKALFLSLATCTRTKRFHVICRPAALLEFYGELSAIPPRILRSRVPLLLDRLELADRSHESISRFSKGMVQRLALAQAMLSEPELLVLDEPMEGLDLNGRRLLQEIIAEQRQAGKAVILVSHALAEVAEVCNRLVVLVAGRLAHVGSLADLVRDPDTGRARPLETALRPLYHS